MPSPDARWEDPRFVLRRLAGLPSVDPALYHGAMGAEIAHRIGDAVARGRARAPILLLAPTPRSGTNLAETLLAVHPRVSIRPGGLAEAPFLSAAEGLGPFARRFGAFHPESGERTCAEWLGHLVTGVLRQADGAAPGGPRLWCLKDPHTRRLDLVPAVFPGSSVMVVLRDGRRTIDSLRRTWPTRFLGRSFADICAEWRLATEAALNALERGELDAIRFEALARRPAAAGRAMMAAVGLDPGLASARRMERAPVLGSSTHSRDDGVVDWRPRERPKDFDPAGRPVDWPARWERTFDRICGAAALRLERTLPEAGAAPYSQSRRIGISGTSAGGMG